MNPLPPMHLINLDRSNDRLRLFRERNGHLQNVVRVPAIDGSELDREALVGSGYISRDLAYPNGQLGCAMSHLKLWETAASQERDVTVFEDDVVISYQFEKIAQELMSRLPNDWDIIGEVIFGRHLSGWMWVSLKQDYIVTGDGDIRGMRGFENFRPKNSPLQR